MHKFSLSFHKCNIKWGYIRRSLTKEYILKFMRVINKEV